MIAIAATCKTVLWFIVGGAIVLEINNAYLELQRLLLCNFQQLIR